MNADNTDPIQLSRPWSIGVDVGGTFTDLVLRDNEGKVYVTKVPSVPSDPSAGVLNALEKAATDAGLMIRDFLQGCRLIVHGSTVATNTILERKGASVGMLTTEGFRDSIEIRRGIRINQWDHRTPFPNVLSPRYLRRPVAGRIDRDGQEVTPLSKEDLEAAVAFFQTEAVDAVAICLFNSYLNGTHEDRAAQILERELPAVHITRSHAVNPIMGEYERSSTAAMNAYVAPVVSQYLTALDQRLHEQGLERPLLMLQSNGGAISINKVVETPVNLLLSGPAAGVGAMDLTARQIGHDNLITMEIGGTSCDVTLMHAGTVPVSDEMLIEDYHLGTPSVDIHTVGAGGGTIAWIDSAGMLQVGPQGAGAHPGPASYGLGGTEPTATDAHLVLGRLRPGPYAGGAVTLDLEKARHAIEEKIAQPLGITAEAAAVGILQLLEQNLLHAVERISIERGFDPSRFILIAAGGAGPMHGSSVGRALGCSQVYIPRQAGAFCAIGMLNSDVRQDFLKVHLAVFDDTAIHGLEPVFTDLMAQANAFLEAEGFASSDRRIVRELDLRYDGQLWSIRVTIPDDDFDYDDLRQQFEIQHERQFGHIQPDGQINITAARTIAYGLIERSTVTKSELKAAEPQPIGHAAVYLNTASEWQDTPRYAGADLVPGSKLMGPLLIEETTTTVFVGPGECLRVDATDNYMIDLTGDGS